jgi:GDP-4-dehydro-6-deoxy-D-mannose reductase
VAALLLSRGYHVVGLDQGDGTFMPKGVEHLYVDLTDLTSVASIPKRWFAVLHLAAASIPSHFSSTVPILYNLQITLNLFEHLEEARVLLISSCHVYAPTDQPRREEGPLKAQGRYGLSKHLCEQIVPHYQGKLDIRIARPFNHLGPGQRAELVIPTLLRKLMDNDSDGTAPLYMNGMNSIRDFIDVRDVANAYLSIMELDNPGVSTFNVCTGKGRSIESLVRESLRLLGLQRPIVFQETPNSSDDIPYLVGDPTRLRQATGWAPKYTLTDSLKAMIHFLGDGRFE